mgnify:CR=1 FL=1
MPPSIDEDDEVRNPSLVAIAELKLNSLNILNSLEAIFVLWVSSPIRKILEG